MQTVNIPQAEDVLREAAKLIASPLPHPWARCRFNQGPYCPRCAAAAATSKFGRKLPAGWTDGALEDAVFFIRLANPPGGEPLSLADALTVIAAAQAHCADW